MPCYHPLNGWHNPDVRTKNGKQLTLFFRKPGPYPGMVSSPTPCGQCRGCRHAKALEWTIRCVHESQLYSGKNSFVTLTYDEKHLPKSGSLNHDHFALFLKRLRKKFVPKCPYQKGTSESKIWLAQNGIRYYMCGEYGEKFSRPHFHAIFFNLEFEDKTEWKKNLYRSKTLERLWTKGYSSIGVANYDSIAYVARYVVKKITGKLAPDHYQGRQPEYNQMSTNPGIARGWYEKYKQTDVFPRDFIALRGKRLKVPKYYSMRYELTNPEEYAILRDMRIKKAIVNQNYLPDRLKAAEQIQISRDNLITRNYEKGN